MLQKELIRVIKNEDEQIEVIFSFFNDWATRRVILNGEDYRLLVETGDKFLKELVIKYIECEIQDNYSNLIKHKFAERTSIDDFAFVTSEKIFFNIRTKSGALISANIDNKDWSENKWIKNIRIPDYFIEKAVTTLRNKLIELGVIIYAIPINKGELEWE